MTTETVLTHRQIGEIAISVHIRDETQDFNQEFARAIEQAVLQSAQARAWKRDSELMDAMVEKRIAVTPEYEGGWHAEMFVDQENTIETGYGSCPRAAIDVAMKEQK